MNAFIISLFFLYAVDEVLHLVVNNIFRFIDTGTGTVFV